MDMLRVLSLNVHEIVSAKAGRTQKLCRTEMRSWKPPLDNVVKTNTDGASKKKANPGLAGAGGLIRDSTGGWIIGFTAHLGVCSNMAAEMHALRFGLMLTWNEG